jgi:hypothetical protein
VIHATKEDQPLQKEEINAQASRHRKDPKYHYPSLCVFQLMEAGGWEGEALRWWSYCNYSM